MSLVLVNVVVSTFPSRFRSQHTCGGREIIILSMGVA